MNIAALVTADGNILIQPGDTATQITLGSATAAGADITLHLTEAELDRLYATEVLQIGSSATTQIDTVNTDADIDFTNSTKLKLYAGAGNIINTGNIDIVVNDLMLDASTAIGAGPAAEVDIDVTNLAALSRTAANDIDIVETDDVDVDTIGGYTRAMPTPMCSAQRTSLT
jgi:hypothetical protein